MPSPGEGAALSKKEQMARYIVLGIGCIKVSKKEFGFNIKDVYGDIIEKLKELELMKENESASSLTENGMGYVSGTSQLFFTRGK
jgi:oxygen-independent coproporphyrinogen-3 oxidase